MASISLFSRYGAKVRQAASGDNEMILVGGASGFVGRNLVHSYLASGQRVRALVHATPFPTSHKLLEVVKADITRPETLQNIAESIDIVVNCAGCLGKWGMKPEIMRQVNEFGGSSLLHACRDGNVKKFVHLSTVGVTGPLGSHVANEDHPCLPVGEYQRSKLAGERNIIRDGADARIPVTVVRPSFTYGPGDDHKLPLFRAIGRGRFAFIGGGAALLHPVYIADLIDGIRKASVRSGTGRVYNIGGSKPATVRELIFAIADSMGVARPKMSVPGIVARPLARCCEMLAAVSNVQPILSRSRVDLMSGGYGYSIARAQEELKFSPSISLQSGIQQTVADYRSRGWL